MRRELKPGARLASVVCSTEVVVVRAPSAAVDVRCGGQSMVPWPGGPPTGSPDPEHGGGTAVGKRFADADSGIELLCVKAGTGRLSLADVPLSTKDAKPLPSSD